jgi:pimeloyl-ACP methyl ester carboxylesterase
MSVLVRALCALLLAFPLAPASAAAGSPVQIAPGLQYELLERWDVERLNRILSTETPAFAGIPVDYTPARNAVRLYRVRYASVIPERGNQPTVASGLVAVPDTADTAFPMVSYQHGTVYGKQEVPSFPEQSPETMLMLAQFAGQGYVVVGADYFGMGESREPEGYMVKASHQQATYDMLVASRAVLEHLKLRTTKLFLAGWSEGGFVTMALLEKLEKVGFAPQGTATASAPLDVFVALNGFLSFPRANDAPWVTTLFILSSFAYERKPVDPAAVPTDLHKLMRAEYFDPHFFADSAYGRLIAGAHAYRWVIQTPVRNYYGDADEAISVGVGRIAMTYQQAIGNGNPRVEAISTGETSHRGTFARAVPHWKRWFDSL